MLRLSLGLGLAAAALFAVRPDVNRVKAPACPVPAVHLPFPAALRSELVPPGKLPAEVKGYGLTVEKAQEAAQRRAAEALADILRAHDPSLLVGSADDPATQERLLFYVTHLMSSTGQQLDDVALENNLPPSKVWALKLRDPDWGRILAGERQARARGRHYLAGETLLGVAALLGLALVALRLSLWLRPALRR